MRPFLFQWRAPGLRPRLPAAAAPRASISSLITDRNDVWWAPKRPDETTLWESSIRLGENFFGVLEYARTPKRFPGDFRPFFNEKAAVG